MKRSILIVFVLLLAFSANGKAQQSNTVEDRNAQTNRLRVIASGEAQQPNAAEAVYNKWRQEAPADEVSKLRFALATVTRRTGDGATEIEFWSVGRVSQTVFEIRPLYFEKLPDGGFEQEQTGDLTKSVVESHGAGGEPGHGFGMKTAFLVKPNTNALEIKWMGYDGGKLQNSTMIQVLLRDEQSENFTTISDGR